METLFTTRYITISYYAPKRCLIQTWKAFCSRDEFREAQQKCVELFIEKKCKNFISDTTNAGLLAKEDTDWAADVITPKLVKAGMTQISMVVPQSVFTKMTLQNLLKAENTNQNTLLKFFDSLDKAMEDIQA